MSPLGVNRFFAAALAIAFLTPVATALVIVSHDRPPGARPTTGSAPSPAARVTPSGPSVPRAFDGWTSQQRRIDFRVSQDRLRIERLSVTYVTACLHSITMELDDTLHTPIAIAPDGTFAVASLGDRLTIRGHITGARASGTLEIHMLYGAMTCNTPSLRWSAAG